MTSWLAKPYPFLFEDTSLRIKLALFVLLFVFGFLAIFQPFNIAEVVSTNVYVASLAYAVNSAVIAYLAVSVIIRLWPERANDRNWTIGKEIALMLGILLIIAVSNYFVGSALGMHALEEMNMLEIAVYDITRTFAVGFFPVMIITFINYTILLKRNMSNVEQHTFMPIETKNVSLPETILISTANGSAELEVNLNDLLYVMADGNYVEFHFRDGSESKREIQRNTMSNLEQQFAEYDHILRTHRAYMVNLNKVIDSKGNAQGYQLKLEGIEEWIPVSRKNLVSFDDKMRSNIDLAKQFHS